MILTCDLHVDKEQIRLLECLNFLDFLKEKALEINDKTIAILGDIFQFSNNIKNQMFVPIFMKFLELKEAGINLIFIPGNHDIISKDNSGTLAETFSSFGKFIQKSETVNVDGFDYDFLAFTKDPTEIPNNSRVLLTHLSIEGFWPSDYIDQSYFENYELVVSGHVHKYQRNNKFFFVGAPYSCNKGEKEYNHGYAIINGTNIEHYEYNDAPEYLIIKAEDFKNYDFNNKLVTVQISKKIENFVKLRNIILDGGALEVVPEFLKEELVEDEAEHKVDINEGIVMSAAKFLEEVKDEKIDNKKLLDCFKNVLKECK